jgi:hypothetical protein
MILSDSIAFAAAPALVLAAAMLGLRLRGDSANPPIGDRLLRRGRMPRTVRRAIEREGIRHLEEGIRIGVTFRGGAERCGDGRCRFHTGAVAVTSRRLVAHVASRRVLNVPFENGGFVRLTTRREGTDGICLEVDAAILHGRTPGTLQYRFRTPAADRLSRMLRETGCNPSDRWRESEITSEFV